eukprot:7840676-Lingulodinium_polyedra.AAC.1
MDTYLDAKLTAGGEGGAEHDRHRARAGEDGHGIPPMLGPPDGGRIRVFFSGCLVQAGEDCGR